jgi:hypothetical protein
MKKIAISSLLLLLGLDHKSAQDQVLNSAIGIAEVGRIFKLSYPCDNRELR